MNVEFSTAEQTGNDKPRSRGPILAVGWSRVLVLIQAPRRYEVRVTAGPSATTTARRCGGRFWGDRPDSNRLMPRGLVHFGFGHRRPARVRTWGLPHVARTLCRLSYRTSSRRGGDQCAYQDSNLGISPM